MKNELVTRMQSCRTLATLFRTPMEILRLPVTALCRLVGKDGTVYHISPSSLFDPSIKNFGRRLPGSAMNVNQILCLLSGGQTKGAGSGTGSGLGAITLFEPMRPRLYCDGMGLVFSTETKYGMSIVGV